MRSNMRFNTSSRFLSLFAASILAIASGCATVTNPVTGQRERTVMDEASEIRAGQEADAQVREEYGVYDNPALQAYVNEVGQKLAAQSHRANLQWKFTVVDSPEINAFALPGGYVYITRGLMAYLNSEAELAGVLGHEIGHVTARHAAARATRETAAGGIGAILGVAGAILGERYGVGGLADAANQLYQGAAQSYILSYGRDQELQSDQLGAEYLHRTGQDPRSMHTVLSVLKQNEIFTADEARARGQQPQKMPTYLSSHPSNDQRLQEIDRIAAQYKGQYGDGGRARYLSKINGITFGDSRAQGMVRGNTFYHEPLGFTLQAPRGWQFQNSASQLLIVSDDNQVGVVMLPAGTSNDPEAAIRKLQADTGRTERLMIHGLPALNFSGAKQGKAIEATVITHKGADYILQPLAKTDQARSARRADLRSVIESFRPMTAEDIARARPYTLRTVPMPAAGAGQGMNTLGQNVSRSIPELHNPLGQVRLLNQVYPQGDIPAGQVVKTIQ
jgi:predicted Zn-dependent protease